MKKCSHCGLYITRDRKKVDRMIDNFKKMIIKKGGGRKWFLT